MNAIMHLDRLCQLSDFAGLPNLPPPVSRRVGRSLWCSRRIAWNRQVRECARPGWPSSRLETSPLCSKLITAEKTEPRPRSTAMQSERTRAPCLN
jgi:hypothetical protein